MSRHTSTIVHQHTSSPTTPKPYYLAPTRRATPNNDHDPNPRSIVGGPWLGGGMDKPRYLDLLDADYRRLRSVAAGALDAKVPSCPEWTVRDLLQHVAGAQGVHLKS